MPPRAARFVVVGAGVHGLSTAWHLAREDADVVVIDKTGIGAGASGIACGIVRNNYFQPAMRRLMAHSVSIWESDPAAFSYHPVGYLQAGHEGMNDDVRQIFGEQQAIGYSSTLVEGEAESRQYLRALFPDWQGENITCVLHEHQGGFANNQASLRGLAAKAQQEGAEIVTGVRVIGIDPDARIVHTHQGSIRYEQLIIAAGPWVRDFWAMLGLPETVAVRWPGKNADKVPMWTYLLVQEGTLEVDPASFTDAQGRPPPVVHVDTDAPLYDEDGALVTDEPWGIYYKPDTNFGGIQGGSMPRRLTGSAHSVAVDPYGPDRAGGGHGEGGKYASGPAFARLWTSGLAHCHARFDGTRHLYSTNPSGGIGCFTPDSFPIFDRLGESVYLIADSNHGYKMIGVGALVAAEVLGEPQELLEPFRFDRYERGALHPISHSPFPWS